jgi:hypothetical protein
MKTSPNRVNRNAAKNGRTPQSAKAPIPSDQSRTIPAGLLTDEQLHAVQRHLCNTFPASGPQQTEVFAIIEMLAKEKTRRFVLTSEARYQSKQEKAGNTPTRLTDLKGLFSQSDMQELSDRFETAVNKCHAALALADYVMESLETWTQIALPTEMGLKQFQQRFYSLSECVDVLGAVESAFSSWSKLRVQARQLAELQDTAAQ